MLPPRRLEIGITMGAPFSPTTAAKTTATRIPGKTLAELYDPEKMPQNLKAAHEHLDDVVKSCYPGYPFPSDEARLECLFKMYEKMTKK